MTVAAKITPTELGDQVRERFVGNYFVAKLLNSAGLAYVPGQQDSLQYVIDYELARTSGYAPQIIGYVAGEVTDYADSGVGLAQKQAIFQHDNSGAGYTFDHVSLQWAGGVVNGLEADPARNPGPLVDADYSNLPVGSSTGDGNGLTVNITVFTRRRGLGYSQHPWLRLYRNRRPGDNCRHAGFCWCPRRLWWFTGFVDY